MYFIKNKILQDNQGNILTTVSNEIFLTSDLIYNQKDYAKYVKAVNSNLSTYVIKAYLLNQEDETPLKDISEFVLSGSLFYNYQQGQTHSLNLTVVNNDNFWSTQPISGTVRNRTKIRLDIGLYSSGNVFWRKCGIFVLKDVTFQGAPNQTVSLQLYDKFALFDKKIAGNISSDFKIPVGTDLKTAIEMCAHYQDENGNVYDFKDIIYEGHLSGIVTPYTVTKAPNTSMGDVIVELANMVSYDVFYNEEGNLTLRPGVDVVSYDVRGVQWYYTDISHLSYAEPKHSIDYGSVVNKLIVRGAITNGNMAMGVAINKNPFSVSNTIINPIVSETIEDRNITSDSLATERAEYELKKRQLLYTKNSFKSIFVPHLMPKDIVMWSCPEFNIYNEKYIIQSLFFDLESGFFMNIDMANVSEVGCSE